MEFHSCVHGTRLLPDVEFYNEFNGISVFWQNDVEHEKLFRVI